MKKIKFNYILILAFIILIGIPAFNLIKNKIHNSNWEIVELSPRASYLKTTIKIAKFVKPKLEKMILGAEKDGMCLIVLSGWRSRERQQYLYDNIENKYLVAFPGTSEHEQGIAVDLFACPMNEQGVRDDSVERLELKKDFDELPEYQWLLENAERYNFEQSYTKENESKIGILAEPWHWRYTKKPLF